MWPLVSCSKDAAEAKDACRVVEVGGRLSLPLSSRMTAEGVAEYEDADVGGRVSTEIPFAFGSARSELSGRRWSPLVCRRGTPGEKGAAALLRCLTEVA